MIYQILRSDLGVSGGGQGLFRAECLRSRHLGNGSPRVEVVSFLAGGRAMGKYGDGGTG